MVHGKFPESASNLLLELGLLPGPNLLRAFLECFSPDKSEELENLVSDNLFQGKKVCSLVSSIQRYFETYCHTLFFMSSGYLGNGPPCIAAGDRMAVFDGAEMPFLVRMTGLGYVLVGPCYVEGLSNGEPATMARRGELPVVDILLI